MTNVQFSFRISGRISRKVYWLWQLCIFIFYMLLGVICMEVFPDGVANTVAQAVASVCSIALCALQCSLTVQRLHDIDYCGFWILIGLVPIIGTFWLLALLCEPGTLDENRYGPPIEIRKRNNKNYRSGPIYWAWLNKNKDISQR